MFGTSYNFMDLEKSDGMTVMFRQLRHSPRSVPRPHISSKGSWRIRGNNALLP